MCMYYMSAIYAMLYVYVPTRQRNSSQINRKTQKRNERKTGTGNSKTK